MRRAALALVLTLAAAAGVAGCGDSEEDSGARPTASTPTVSTPTAAIKLTVVADDGAGARQTGTLTCGDGDARAEGALNRGASAAKLCTKARGLAKLLTTQPATNRACTQIYGGPETARVTGTIDGDRVERRFSRTNGCEIADFTRAEALLQP